MTCIFCAIRDGQIPSVRVYEDERIIAFMDINPLTDGHLLVVPKAHAETIWELSDEDARAVMSAARKLAHAIRHALAPDGLNLVQANGRAAHQTVFHFHLHLIPRWANDGKHLSWPVTPGQPDHIRGLGQRIATAVGQVS
jgi:histidine triad (HIT) family protein